MKRSYDRITKFIFFIALFASSLSARLIESSAPYVSGDTFRARVNMYNESSIPGKILPGKSYTFTLDPIDVVIPCVEKDLDTLERCISGVRENCKDVGKIYVVSKNKLSENAIWIPESYYPFSKFDIAFEIFGSVERSNDYMANPQNRLGWMYQQLLKLYAPFVIEGISSNVLIVDADTVFLNPVAFTGENGAGLFNVGDEYHDPYFEHMRRLLPDLCRVFSEYSGICHHMLFQRCVLSDLRSHIEEYHQKPMWKAIVHCIDHNDLGTGLSEYEMYFNFAFLRSNQFLIRPLSWLNVDTLQRFEEYRQSGYHYVSAHAYMR